MLSEWLWLLITIGCVFTANARAIIGETEATGDYKNISLTGYDIYNFYSNQIVEVFQVPDSKSTAQLVSERNVSLISCDQSAYTRKQTFNRICNYSIVIHVYTEKC